MYIEAVSNQSIIYSSALTGRVQKGKGRGNLKLVNDPMPSKVSQNLIPFQAIHHMI